MKIVLLLTLACLAISLGNKEPKRYVINVECGGLTTEQCDTMAEKSFQEYCKTSTDNICKGYDIFNYDEAAELDIDLSTVSECIDNYGSLTKCKCKAEILDSETGQQGIICRDIKSNDKVTSTASTGLDSNERLASSLTPSSTPIIGKKIIDKSTSLVSSTALTYTTVANSYSTSEQNATYLNKTIEAEILRKHGWNETSNGIFYKLFHDKAVYTKARTNCEQQKAVLASKTVRDSFGEIVTMLKSDDIIAWIGLNDIETEATWVWEDGITSNATIPWYEDDPSNYAEINQDCAALRLKIFDGFCSSTFKYICEITV